MFFSFIQSAETKNPKHQTSRIKRKILLKKRQWQDLAIYWIGAILVGIIAVIFAELGDYAADIRNHLIDISPYSMLCVAPVGMAVITWITRVVFNGAQGSGIPQTIATLHIHNFELIDKILSIKITIGKILMTSLGLICGASIGREGPSVQIGASIMHAFSRLIGKNGEITRHGMILAGGAAGMAAAFNTPLAGIVFAIEELAHSFEQKASGRTLAIIIFSGVTSIAFLGNYTYFGRSNTAIPLGSAWIAVGVCGVLGGAAGGIFSRTVLAISEGRFFSISALQQDRPIIFAGCCGFVLAMLGLESHGATYGTGYLQANGIVNGYLHYPASFFIMKYISILVTFASGIPGGMFAPSLAIGAGLGGWISPFLPHTTPSGVVLLGMAAYFCGVAQSPLTATIIVMEICDNQQITLALLSTSFLAYVVSRIICPTPLYTALAKKFERKQLDDAIKLESSKSH